MTAPLIRVAFSVMTVCVVTMAGLSATWAGQAPASSETVKLQFAATGTALTMKVVSSCRKGKNVFRMTNTGNAWPGPAKLQVVDASNGDVISSRTLKLQANQSAGFAVRPESGAHDFELRLDAHWLGEPFRKGVQQSCQ